MSISDKWNLDETMLLLRSFEEHGISVEHLRRFQDDSEYADYVARVFTRGAFKSSAGTHAARLALGNSLYDTSDWIYLLQARFTKKETDEALQFPWSEDLLLSPCPFYPDKLVKDTHVAFFGISKLNGVPLTIALWYELMFKNEIARWEKTRRHLMSGNKPSATSALANTMEGLPPPAINYLRVETLESRWYLMLEGGLHSEKYRYSPSTPLTALLPPHYEVASTIATFTMEALRYFRNPNARNYYGNARAIRCAESYGEKFSHVIGDDTPGVNVVLPGDIYCGCIATIRKM